MTTYKNILFTVFFLFTLTATFAQATHAQSKRTAILRIIKSCKQIDAYKKYKIVSIDNAEEFLEHNPDNGASLKGYFKSGILKKIVEVSALSYKVITTAYYFDNGKLIFVYTNDSKYKYIDSTQSLDYSKLEAGSEGRYYFSNGKLLEAKFTEKELYKSAKEDAMKILNSGKKYAKILEAQQR